ncbi:hypothetical protein [Burkholderia sp. Ac-20365]|jgi:hypothetical protein|uniref:hypothetical protein n=1 Tax=Burkholderia sp. Ac-20365 TaxID=2703897 RepID=UPI00197B1C99|nr:hypothetical protein [Burkholderia sp. Ac-20365]MBN3763763.1 hypothetical protein [Burkholderia sp. Ac-20365]
MDIFKPLALSLLLVGGAANAGTLQPASHTADRDGRAPMCDSVSFATGTAQNRAACRRMFAREARPTVQTSPLTASDYAS